MLFGIKITFPLLRSTKVGSVLTRAISSKRKEELPSSLSPIAEGDEKKRFTSLLDLSFKWRIPIKEMKVMTDFIEKDASVLKKKGMVEKLVENVVMENICLVPEEIKLFKLKYRVFIAQDVSEKTSRFAALELFKSIFTGKKSHKKVNLRTKSVVKKLLEPKGDHQVWASRKWRDRECGLRLVTCLVDSSIVCLKEFEDVYSSLLIKGSMLLRAAALRLILTAARNGQKKPAGLMDLLVLNIGARNSVVQSYAATCVKETILGEKRKGETIFASIAVIQELFRALEFPGSEDNEHIMECLFVILEVADDEVARFCLTRLLRQLHKDSKIDEFNRFVFMSLAVLMRLLGEAYLQAPIDEEVIRVNCLSKVLMAGTRLIGSKDREGDQLCINAVITVVANCTKHHVEALTEEEKEEKNELLLSFLESVCSKSNQVNEANKAFLLKLSALYEHK